MAGKGEIIIKILGDPSGLQSALGGAESALGSFGGGITSVVSAGTLALAGLAAAVVGVGASLFAIGSTFDSATDKIRVGTGATGQELAGLEEDFKAVFSTTASDADTVGTAITKLNQRLELTGAPLQDLTKQFLRLSSMTGTDVAQNIDNVTRLFGDWGIAADQMPGTLDKLFRATQESGIGLDQLSTTIVQFGAPLRQLGFSFDESVAMLAKWNKEGVNVDTAMAGMRKSVATLARDGELPAEAFKRTLTEIQNMQDPIKRTSAAMELFGAKAGPDMAAAIAEGRFNFGEMMTDIAGGGDTINTAAGDISSFGGKLTVLKNKVMAGLEPIATKVFDSMGEGLAKLMPYAEQAYQWFGEFLPQAGEWLMNRWAEIEPAVMPAIKQIVAWVSENFPKGIEVLKQAWNDLVPKITATWETVKQAVGQAIDWLQVNIVPKIQEFVKWVGEAWQGIVNWTNEWWPKISDVISQVMTHISNVIGIIVGGIQWVWDNFGQTIMTAAQSVWDSIYAIIETVINLVRGIIETVLSLLTGDWEGAWNSIKETVRAVWDGIWEIVSNMLEVIWSLLKEIGPKVWEIMQGAWDGIWQTFKGVVNKIVELWNGLDFGIHIQVPDWVPGIGGRGFDIDDIIPDIPMLAKGGLVSSPTVAMIGEGGESEIVSPVSTMREIVRDEVSRSIAGAGAGAAGQPIVVQVMLNDRVLAEAIASTTRERERMFR